MKRIRQWLRRLFKRDKWDRIPTVTDLKQIAERDKKRKNRACTFFTLP